MILIDANVWIDHLRRPEPHVDMLLARGQVVMHPYLLGEIALGGIGDRRRVLSELARLLEVVVATHDEVLAMIEAEPLFGRGIGYIDAHLVAALRLTPNVQLWTRDKRLRRVAIALELAADLD